MKEQDIKFGSDWDKWVNVVALFVIAIGFFVLGYIQLRRMKKLK